MPGILFPSTTLPGTVGARTCQQPYRLDASGQGYDNFGPCEVYGTSPPLGYEKRQCAQPYYRHPSPSGDVYYDKQGYCLPTVQVTRSCKDPHWKTPDPYGPLGYSYYDELGGCVPLLTPTGTGWLWWIVVGGIVIWLAWPYIKGWIGGTK